MRRRWFTVAAVAALVVLLAACGAPGPDVPDGPEAITDQGAVRGVHNGLVDTFLGIPYAADPVVSLRWTDPQPGPRWSGVRAADRPGSDCVRKAPEAPNGVTGSEDCLFLNVTAPAGQTSGLPVLFYVHGGNAEVHVGPANGRKTGGP